MAFLYGEEMTPFNCQLNGTHKYNVASLVMDGLVNGSISPEMHRELLMDLPCLEKIMETFIKR